MVIMAALAIIGGIAIRVVTAIICFIQYNVFNRRYCYKGNNGYNGRNECNGNNICTGGDFFLFP